MAKICAYTGNLYFDAFVNHVKEIKDKGFDVILLTISETDMLYNLSIFKDFKTYAESEGLEVWCTYWGLTAGEALSSKASISVNNLFAIWLIKVYEVGFDNILIDEPGKKDLNSILMWVQSFKADIKAHLCLADDTFNSMSDEDIKELPVKSIGVSCYHWVKDWRKITDITEAICNRLQSLRPNDNFIFIQGFDIEPGWELIPLVVKEQAEICGIKNFALWSFRCTIATGTKRPVNAHQIWKSINWK